MMAIGERERVYRRRLLASAGAAFLLVAGMWRFFPPPVQPAPPVLVASSEGLGVPGLVDLHLGGWQKLDLDRPIEPDPSPEPEPPVENPRAPEAATSPPPPADPAAGVVGGIPIGSSPEIASNSPGANPPADAGLAMAGGATPGSSGEVDFRDGPGEPLAPSASAVLGLRVLVAPRVPEKIMRKRKIDDYVLLKAFVGPDGRVRDVQVLRKIDNCEECTQSALDAARQYVYNAPSIAPDSTGVWTEPFPIQYTYQGRKRR